MKKFLSVSVVYLIVLINFVCASEQPFQQQKELSFDCPINENIVPINEDGYSQQPTEQFFPGIGLFPHSQENQFLCWRSPIVCQPIYVACDQRGRTILHEAAARGDYFKVLRLLQQRHPVNCVSQEGLTPLCEVACHIEWKKEKIPLISSIVQLLVTYGANLTLSGPLHWAAVNGNMRVAKLLLCEARHSKDYINLCDSFGRTPLHCAIGNWQMTMAGWLLDRGANPSISDYNKVTPFDLFFDMSEKEQINSDLYEKLSEKIKNFHIKD